MSFFWYLTILNHLDKSVIHCNTFVNTLYLHFARPCYYPYSLFFILYLKEKEKGKKALEKISRLGV